VKRQNQKQKLEALVRDLECELSEGKSQAGVLEETQERLLKAERICQELADENRRLEEEVTDWHRRLGKSEESQKQLNMLQQQLDTLRAVHARVIEKNRRLQEQSTAPGHIGGVKPPVEGTSAAAVIVKSNTSTGEGTPSGLVEPKKASGAFFAGSYLTLKMFVANLIKKSRIAWNSIDRKWQIGSALASVLVLVIASVVTLKNLRGESPVSREPTEHTDEAIAVKNEAEPISEPKRRPTLQVQGMFQTVRPTQVFTAPSEDSDPVVSIGAGVRVNVVDSRGGWLEIRSKHGRPPGFIRQETAARIGSN
jgi:hypothetical protein